MHGLLSEIYGSGHFSNQLFIRVDNSSVRKSMSHKLLRKHVIFRLLFTAAEAFFDPRRANFSTLPFSYPELCLLQLELPTKPVSNSGHSQVVLLGTAGPIKRRMRQRETFGSCFRPFDPAKACPYLPALIVAIRVARFNPCKAEATKSHRGRERTGRNHV